MKKLTVLGIIGGAALLAAVPFSIQWSQTNGGSAGPTMLLTLSQAEAAANTPSDRGHRSFRQ